MVPYMVTDLAAYLDLSEHFYFINVTTGGYGITIDESLGSLSYLCGLLNSSLLQFFLRCVSSPFHGGYIAANRQFLERLPIYPINFRDRRDRDRYDQIEDLAKRMQTLHKQISSIKNPHDMDTLQRQIDGAQRQINEIVYLLYGLSDKEIQIVEEAR